MATITTRLNQRRTASAARRVGGYSELVRLTAERLRRGRDGVITRNANTGQFSVKPADAD